MVITTAWDALGMSRWRGQTASWAAHGRMIQRQEIVMPPCGKIPFSLYRGAVGILLVPVSIGHTEEHFLARDGLVHLGQSRY